jgi:hypothetical protein
MSYELTIECFNDASSGIYDSFEAARAATDEAAGVDDLEVEVRSWSQVGERMVAASGVFRCSDGAAVFGFRIEPTTPVADRVWCDAL